jgi:hypothetical protein
MTRDPWDTDPDDPDGPPLREPAPADLTWWIWGCGVLFGLLAAAVLKWSLSP